jgi:hypothetical protein
VRVRGADAGCRCGCGVRGAGAGCGCGCGVQVQGAGMSMVCSVLRISVEALKLCLKSIISFEDTV